MHYYLYRAKGQLQKKRKRR